MKKVITLLSLLVLAFSGVAYGATTQAVQANEEKIEVAKTEDQTKTAKDIQWEKAHAYAHYRSETR